MEDDYKYDSNTDSNYANGILINRNLEIHGGGHTINGSDLASVFYQYSNTFNIYLYDINFVDCHGFSRSTVQRLTAAINCTFIRCKSGFGGVLYSCDAINCTFINNSASDFGGAMVYGNAINCTFLNNSGFHSSTYHVDAYACYFNDYHLDDDYFNAFIYGCATACIFENDCYGEEVTIIPGAISARNFKTLYDSSEKMYFDIIADYKKYDGINVTIDVYSRSGSLVRTYHGLTGADNGCLIDLDPGKYTATLHSDCAGIADANITISVYLSFPIISAPDFITTDGSDETFLITVVNEDNRPIENGSVKIVFNGDLANYTVNCATDANGEIQVPIKEFVPGVYHVDIYFLESDYYEEGYNTSTVFIKYFSEITYDYMYDDYHAIAHQEALVNFTLHYLYQGERNPCPNETLNILIQEEDGKVILNTTAITDSEGKASVSFTPLSIKNLIVTASFDGNPEENRYNATENEFNVHVFPIETKMNISVENTLIDYRPNISVNLTDINDNAVVGGKIILSFDDGTDPIEILIDGNRTVYEAKYYNANIAKDVNVTATFVPEPNDGY